MTTPNTPARLAADQITLRYAADAPPALAALSLALAPGVFHAVIGPNGSGKSTLVRALSRALRPSQGAVLLDEADLYAAYSARESAQAIAVVPQDTGISLDFSVRDVVRMGRAPHLPPRPFASETPADEDIVADAMKSAGVDALAERAVTTLSGGERQRVLLARALAQKPRVLLLDEPTANLDLRHQAETLTLARDLAHERGLAVLAVLHDVNLAAAYCDTLTLLRGGEIAASGTPAAVLTETNLAEVYGARVWVRPHPATGRPWALPLPALPPAPKPTVLKRVHVICGGGTGAARLMLLHGRGYTLTAGALHADDADADAARRLGIAFSAESPFSLLSYAALEAAARLAADASAVVLTDVPFGRANLANLEAALSLRRAGRAVVCVHPGGFEARDFSGGAALKLWAALLAAGAETVPDDVALLAFLDSPAFLDLETLDGSRD